MPKKQAWFLQQPAWCWGLVRNVWLKQAIQNLLIQYCGRGVNKWCLTFFFLDSFWIGSKTTRVLRKYLQWFQFQFALRNNYQYFWVPEQKQTHFQVFLPERETSECIPVSLLDLECNVLIREHASYFQCICMCTLMYYPWPWIISVETFFEKKRRGEKAFFQDQINTRGKFQVNSCFLSVFLKISSWDFKRKWAFHSASKMWK